MMTAPRTAGRFGRLAAAAGLAALALLAALFGAPAASAAETAQNPCDRTVIHGGLGLGLNKQITIGGPNFTSGACRDINIKLTTNAAFRTYAMACLETAHGVDCPENWVLLDYDTWTVLRYNVAGDSRWQLRMYADSPETVDFDYTA